MLSVFLDYIELIDTVGKRKVICNNIKEYEDAIEQMGSDYGSKIEVTWQKDDNVTILHMEEVRIEISKYQKMFDSEALK